MYKLIIVDDEVEIRNGLCNYFPWSQLGFEIVAQFEDGLQTMKYLKKNNHIDCLLCDIKMPFMDGLELAKELSVHDPKIKIILLSGHRNFDYAREALVYQVKDYILKPAKYEELIRVFTKIKTELDQSQALNVSPHPLTDGGNYNKKIILVIKTYLQQNYPTATLDEAAQLVHMNPYYLSKFFKDKTGENFSDYLLAVRMDKAAELLNDITYKTYEISEMVGYSNPKNFTRTFKKYFGKTPKEFRSPD